MTTHNDFRNEVTTMLFCVARGYLIRTRRLLAEEKHRDDLLVSNPGNNITADNPPLGTAYHPQSYLLHFVA